MTREEAIKYFPLIEAHKNGATIEYKKGNGEWCIATTPTWCMSTEFRIKPKVEYRPFNVATVVHYAGLTVKHKSSTSYSKILAYDTSGVTVMLRASILYVTYVDFLDNFEFKDGRPCGIKQLGYE